MLGIVFSCRQDRRLKELLRRGELLGGEEALTKHVLQEETRKIQIRLVEGLPTSFPVSYTHLILPLSPSTHRNARQVPTLVSR